jgi:HK97 gp10 family phage protein
VGNISVSSFDDRAFRLELPIAFEELKLEAKKINQERAERIRDRAKQIVHRLSGETRDSLEVKEVADGVEVGSHLQKAIYEEFGTSKMSARPFMRPAIAENLGR